MQSLLDTLLREQRDLSAVEQFDAWQRSAAEPEDRCYSERIPLSRPAPGEQYAFEVRLDDCSGCKACVTACHSLNGLEDGETWRRVGLLVTGPSEPASRSKTRRAPSAPVLLQHVTTACHHCVEPGCLHGCPVLAYEKDPVTGIVRHLDDQCIGCTYCVLMCPYEVPQYSRRLGIVRKCDMCHGRLAAGEAPACVQACPSGAIRIRTASTDEIRRSWRRADGRFLPDAPDPATTLPSTRYLTSRTELTDARAADARRLEAAEPHWPLIGFLLLSQMAVGLAITLPILPRLEPGAHRAGMTFALVSQCLAIVIAGFHLGRPERAWKSFLGWRTSWFSREVILFSAFTALLSLTVLIGPEWWLAGPTAASGLAGVVCSAMIYAATSRPFWSAARTLPRFLAATLALGAAGSIAFQNPDHARAAAWVALAAAACGFAWEAAVVHRSEPSAPAGCVPRPSERREAALHRSALLARRAFLAAWQVRCLFALLTCMGLLAIAGGGGSELLPLIMAPLAAGLVIERFLFFTTVAPDRMPGGVTP